MICPSCGGETSSLSKICLICGAPLSESGAPSPPVSLARGIQAPQPRILPTDATVCERCGTSESLMAPVGSFTQPLCSRCWWGFVNRRQAAGLIDIGVLIGSTGFLVVAWVILARAIGDAASPLLLVAFFWSVLGYWIVRDLIHPQGSLGKLLCGVRVVDVHSGQPATAGQRVRRNLPLCALTILPYSSIYIAFLLGRGDGRRPGDGLASTRVEPVPDPQIGIARAA